MLKTHGQPVTAPFWHYQFSKVCHHTSKVCHHTSKVCHHGLNMPPHTSKTGPHTSKMPPHASKMPPHASKMASHGLKLPPHEAKVPPHRLKTPAHKSKSPPHGFKMPSHEPNQPPHALNPPRHGQNTTSHGRFRPAHGFQLPIHEPGRADLRSASLGHSEQRGLAQQGTAGFIVPMRGLRTVGAIHEASSSRGKEAEATQVAGALTMTLDWREASWRAPALRRFGWRGDGTVAVRQPAPAGRHLCSIRAGNEFKLRQERNRPPRRGWGIWWRGWLQRFRS
ncbi:MAG: hypothetical protein RL514_1686 [Verrucomicrobiota bacterium]|jgi:hypothetical protein